MLVDSLHAVPVARIELPNFISNKELKILKSLERHYHKDKVNISKDIFILNNKKLKSLKEKFDKQANYYMKNVLKLDNEIYACQSWTAKSSPGVAHHLHAHKGCLFSCVYYIYGECKIHFNFVRSRIHEVMNLSFDVIEYNTFNGSTHWYNTYPGLLIIFPSNILHESEITQSDKFLIGANYFVKGVIGKTDHKVDSIKIKPY